MNVILAVTFKKASSLAHILSPCSETIAQVQLL